MRIVLLSLSLSFLLLGCQEEEPRARSFAPFLNERPEAVDSMLRKMSIEEKIGQLIFLRSAAGDYGTRQQILQWAGESKIGGLFLTGLSILDFADLVDSVQQNAAIPLFIGTSERIITNNQFTDVDALPSAATILALPDHLVRDRLQDYFYTQIRQLGINCWVDDGTSFGFNDQQQKDGFAAWLQQLNERRVLSLSGRMTSSILAAPDTSFIPAGIVAENTAAVRSGLSGIGIDSAFVTGKLPRPLPVNFWEAYLHKKFGFDGLNVAEVAGETSLDLTLPAGADLFMVRDRADEVYAWLYDRYTSGQISDRRLDASVRKVLLAKQWMREDLPPQAEEETSHRMKTLRASVANWEGPGETETKADRGQLDAHFHGPGWKALSRRIYEEALTVASNEHRIIPLESSTSGFHLLEYSDRSFDEFRSYFKKYADYRSSSLQPDTRGRLPSPGRILGQNEVGILLLDEYLLHGRRDSQMIGEVRKLGREGRLVLVNFREPSNLVYFDSSLTVLQLYERNDLNEQLAAQLLFGAVPATGRLPVTINDQFPKGKGVFTSQVRLQYAPPEAVGIAPEKLVGIDAIALTAIDDGATPGCQVLVAKSGKIIYSKSFGYHSYGKEQAVQPTDLYDLASVTKVAATTLAAMKLYDEKEFNLDDKLKDHLECDRKSTIRNIPLRRLFIHQSGLQPHMPVIPYLLDRDRPNAECDRYFCKEGQGEYTVKVAEDFYFDRHHLDTIWQDVHRLRLGSQRRYRYSDVNFILIQRMIEEKTGLTLDEAVYRDFYQPLGLRHLTFNPSGRFDLAQITPTHNDLRWRQQLVHGYVHDETAALMGGVGGNAGLFGNAEDLAVLFQMLLNNGQYGGRRYLSPETIDEFTSARHGNHRGLGFDKPSRTNYSARAGSAPPESYGHTGFTGTVVWVDPTEELIFIFLSNRVHPSSRNGLLFKKTVRRRIHQVVYDALNSYFDEIPGLETAGS